jgi:ABC-type transport system involved in cytochrome c biogenesis permease subunit
MDFAISDLLGRFTAYFPTLSLESQIVVLVVAGLAFILLAVRTFRTHFVLSLVCLGAAMFLFWTALYEYSAVHVR